MAKQTNGSGKTNSTGKASNGRRTADARSKTTRGGTGSRTTSTQNASKRSSNGRKPTTPRTPSASKKNSRQRQLNIAQKALIAGMGIVFLTAILILSLLSPTQGQLTANLSALMMRLFGWGGVIVPLVTGAIGLYLVLWGMEQPPNLPSYRLVGFLLLFISFEALASHALLLWDDTYSSVAQIAAAGAGGGYLGGTITSVLVSAFGDLGAVFTMVVVAIVGAILLSGVTRHSLGEFLQALFTRPTEDEVETAVPDEIPIHTRGTRRTVRRSDPPGQPPLLPIEPTPQPESSPAAATAAAPTAPAAERVIKRPSRRAAEPAKTEEAPTIVTPVFLGSGGPAINWQKPTVADILEPGTDTDPTGALIREQVEIIEHTLESFGAPAAVVEINQGPTITQFGVEPSFIQMRNGKRTKVKVGKIASLADDLTLALHAQAIRIQAPVPGKGYVGIEVPNPAKAVVSLRDVMETAEFLKIKTPLAIGLGQDVAGQPIVADLTKMPHLLIAGATGSGKSVCVNAIIACLLLQNTPETLKLVMVDPKRVELTGYNGIPHLAAPVVVEMDRVIGVLQWAMREMDNRYKLFAAVGARNITDYNKKAQRGKDMEALPYIVIIVDELADLMMMSPEETERGITRLAQLARATGMHMVIATQRPSVDVVTGLIKANFPARVAFAVASSTDSRVILDHTGAERLLGQGDMLYQAPDAAAPVRSQGCYVSDKELGKLIDYWRTARRFNLIPAQESIQKREIPPVIIPPMPPANAESTPPTTTVTPGAPVINMGTPGAAAGATAVTPPKPAKPAKPNPPTPLPPAAADDEDEPTALPHTTIQPAPLTLTPQPISRGETAVTPATKQQPLWEALQEIDSNPAPESSDDLLPEAIALVRKLNKASTSLLQRRFRIGYTRSARMIDAMEEMGIIGPPTGTSKAREVLPWSGQAQFTPGQDEEFSDE